MLKFKGGLTEMKDFFSEEKRGLELSDFFDVTSLMREHEDDYKKVLAEVNFETGNVEFKDAGNYMEVPIEVVKCLCNQLEVK